MTDPDGPRWLRIGDVVPEQEAFPDPTPPPGGVIPLRELRPGHHIAGGVVSAVRWSKSGLTAYVTYVRPDGSEGEFSQYGLTNIVTFG